jgi:ketosteroid isomerase-like protein
MGIPFARLDVILPVSALAISAFASLTHEPPSSAHQAHDSYAAAINSNDLDALMADLTDDVVYQSPGAREIVGKEAVRAWGAAYLKAYRVHREKTPIGFTSHGDWAYERYTYKSTDTDRRTGAVRTDSGKGVNVFRRGKDGKWRVALDGWSSDKAVGV